jgi:predicted transcriptional regulator
MTDISKAIDLTYLRGQVIALYKLKNKMQETINKLEEEIKEEEKK